MYLSGSKNLWFSVVIQGYLLVLSFVILGCPLHNLHKPTLEQKLTAKQRAGSGDTTSASATIRKYPHLSADLDDGEEQTSRPLCNKETCGKKQIQQWTRRRFFVVHGGGHIDAWQPLYQYV